MSSIIQEGAALVHWSGQVGTERATKVTAAGYSQGEIRGIPIHRQFFLHVLNDFTIVCAP